ncbi:MAG: hypothetical protein WD063_05510 [Pirellulales bacterium]
MGYQFPPNIERMVQQRMSAGGYRSQDELLADAMLALEDVEQRQSELRAEISRRIARWGATHSQPLDRAAFKAEARRRRGQTE